MLRNDFDFRSEIRAELKVLNFNPHFFLNLPYVLRNHAYQSTISYFQSINNEIICI